MLNFDPPVAQRSWASRRRLFVVLGVAALVLVPTVGSTLAGSISINSNNSVEFGQGTVMTTGCDDSITITPTSEYVPEFSAFLLRDITVSGVDDTTCAGVFFMIKMYDSDGAVVPLCDSDDGLFVLLDTTFATDASSSCAALTSADSTGFVYQLDQLVAAASVNSLSIESSGTSTNAPAEYSVGQTGPGGGIIFYVNMRRPVGSQYFEAACAGWSDGMCGGSDLTDPEAEWGCSGSSIQGADGTAIGTGEQNTTEIVADCSDTGIAAKVAKYLTLGGQSDWFLPSSDELYQMYAERARVGGFSLGYYRSSSEYVVNGVNGAYGQGFVYGDPNIYNKDGPGYVRPVRSF